MLKSTCSVYCREVHMCVHAQASSTITAMENAGLQNSRNTLAVGAMIHRLHVQTVDLEAFQRNEIIFVKVPTLENIKWQLTKS